MTVQDNERERELVRLFNLKWDVAHQRSGVDAMIDVKVDGHNFSFEIEVKSSTTNSVTTARDFGMNHINKWRKMLLIIGFYSKHSGRPELQKCLCLTPLDMEPWLSSIEQKILIDYHIAQIISDRLVLDDLFSVCGKSDFYTISDAKELHKRQWTSKQYIDSQDITVNGVQRISQIKMLKILQLRAEYIANRGATLNNPQISRKYLTPFFGGEREIINNWANRIRAIAEKFIRDNPSHPSIIST